MDDTAASDWLASMSKQIGTAIQKARGPAGLSAVKLAGRTADLGYPVHRVAISKIESGERVITVPELVVLAAALGVPPLALAFPDITADFEVLPGKPVPGFSALGWFIGAGGSVGIGRDYSYAPDGVATSDAMRIPLRLLQIDETLMQQRHSLLQSERPIELGMVDNPALQEDMKRQAEITRQTIKTLENERDRLIEVYRKSIDDD